MKKEMPKNRRHAFYKSALKNYEVQIKEETLRGLCFLFTHIEGGEHLNYNDIPVVFPEFGKHQNKLIKEGESWPRYFNIEYRIKLLKKWIKSTAPIKK